MNSCRHCDRYNLMVLTCWVVFPWELKETVGKIMKKWGNDTSLLQEQKAKLIEAGVSKILLNRFMKEITEEEDC